MPSYKILVAEDDTLLSELIGWQLRDAGYEFVCVGSGEQAVETALRENPDLVIMDMNLEGSIDGIQAASKIYEHSPLPVIFMTGYEEEEIISRHRTVPGSLCIIKPMDISELLNIIRSCLENAQK